jgi:hypothetical protein
MTPHLRLLDRGVARHALQLGSEHGEMRLLGGWMSRGSLLLFVCRDPFDSFDTFSDKRVRRDNVCSLLSLKDSIEWDGERGGLD